jgi:hypothetical protein
MKRLAQPTDVDRLLLLPQRKLAAAHGLILIAARTAEIAPIETFQFAATMAEIETIESWEKMVEIGRSSESDIDPYPFVVVVAAVVVAHWSE